MAISKKEALEICESLHIFFGRNNKAAKKLLMFVKSVEEGTDAKLRINSGLNINSVKVIDNDGNTITECPVEIGSLTYHMLNHKTESNDIQKDARVMAEFVEHFDDGDSKCATCIYGSASNLKICGPCGNNGGVDNYEMHPALKVYKKYLRGE